MTNVINFITFAIKLKLKLILICLQIADNVLLRDLMRLKH